MNPTGDYTVHFADPDMCVFINVVLSVRIDSRLVKLLPVARHSSSHHTPYVCDGLRQFKGRTCVPRRGVYYVSDLPRSTHRTEDDQMRTRASLNTLTVSRLTVRADVLLPVYSPSPWDRREQVGSLPCVLRFRKREAPESCQVA